MPSTCPDETKYEKRKKQNRRELLKALFSLGVAMAVLGLTGFVLLYSSDNDSKTMEKIAQLKMHKNSFMGQEKFDRFKGKLGSVTQVFHKNQNHVMEEHEEHLQAMDQAIIQNANSGIVWANPDFLPFLSKKRSLLVAARDMLKLKKMNSPREFFHVNRRGTSMQWQQSTEEEKPPFVDFTKHSYGYPEKLIEPPATLGDYPKLRPMQEIYDAWPQDDIDHPPTPFQEVLIHFDYTNPEDVEAARKFRDAKLPFKFINVPEVVAAGEKWTDEYLANEYFNHNSGVREGKVANGACQESSNNFFAFFNQDSWDVESMGLAPTRKNDYTFEEWAKHARYADSVGLDSNQPHFYWQSGVDREERFINDKKQWTFISRDLPSFSSATETFFVFNPEMQKGIQCRFGERGVTAATHFDAGRNMIAMMTGAKRYVLSPPRECPKLGIVPTRGNAMFRHSMLNFGHLTEQDNPDMPPDELEWMKASGQAMAIDTVLKAGEVLYIPSHWFHYITSLQKSAQCNVRSGVDIEGDAVFGGQREVAVLCDPAI